MKRVRRKGEKETDSPELYLTPPPATQTTNAPTGNAPRRRREQTTRVDQPAVPKFSRRAALADAITKENPLLARAMVNRVWAMLFGRGLVHPVDLMDSKHLPSHPELLDWLARDFERSGYDVKRLVRLLCSTRAYQLDSKPASSKKPASPDSFAQALDKAALRGTAFPIAARRHRQRGGQGWRNRGSFRKGVAPCIRRAVS
jgi:hypothetical protein